MTTSQFEANVRYLTNADGAKTDVVIPVELWMKLLEALQSESGLDSIDELEPNSQILADFQTALRQVRSGETFPLSELWKEIEA
ncbi:MAG: hypothetical protein WBA76_07110 [Phormidesmis sp.]